jgi:hypothetical protein
VAVTSGGPELGPVISFEFFLKRNSLLNFVELYIYQSVILITLSMNISQNLFGLFVAFPLRSAIEAIPVQSCTSERKALATIRGSK